MIPSESELSTLRARYTAASQAHVFTFWHSLNQHDQTKLYTQLLTIDPERVNSIYEAATKQAQLELEQQRQRPSATDSAAAATAEAVAPLVQPPPKERVGSTIHGGPDLATQVDAWREAGLDAIRRGKVAVVLMAGGQGTRLGSSAPKGCYDIGLESHKSLFQLQAERIRRLQTLAAATEGAIEAPKIPWYIMTSGPTRQPTEEFFAQHKFFGLNEADVVFFEQGEQFAPRRSPFERQATGGAHA